MGSANSNIISVTVNPIVLPPVLSLQANDPLTEVFLSWTGAGGGGLTDSGSAPITDSSGAQIGTSPSGATAFRLYRSIDKSAFSLYRTFIGSVSNFIDSFDPGPIDTEHTYSYYLTAAIDSAVSGPSNEVTVGDETLGD